MSDAAQKYPFSVEDLECPILKATMIDPVIAEDGCTYERSAIEDWFSGKSRPTSPMTGEFISKTLIPNYLARKCIDSLGLVNDTDRKKRVNSATIPGRILKRTRTVSTISLPTNEESDDDDVESTTSPAITAQVNRRGSMIRLSLFTDGVLDTGSMREFSLTPVRPRSNAAQDSDLLNIGSRTPDNQQISALGYTSEHVPSAPLRRFESIWFGQYD
jgi:hypothetical protein